MEILESITNNADLFTDELFVQSQSLLDDFLALDEEDHVPTPEVAEKSAEVIDNLLQYSTETDCNATSNTTQSLKENFDVYLDRMSKGMVSESLPNEEGASIKKDSFSMFS